MQIRIFACLAADRVRKVFALVFWTDPISSAQLSSDQFEMVACPRKVTARCAGWGEKGCKYGVRVELCLQILSWGESVCGHLGQCEVAARLLTRKVWRAVLQAAITVLAWLAGWECQTSAGQEKLLGHTRIGCTLHSFPTLFLVFCQA